MSSQGDSASHPTSTHMHPPTGNTGHPQLTSTASAIPPSVLATLIIGLHARPRQTLPLLLFPIPLFASTYLNLAGFPTASGGITAAWSGLYALTAMRRRQGFRGKMSVRGGVRGAAIGVGVVNAVGGGLAYAMGSWEEDERERVKRNRWGQ